MMRKIRRARAGIGAVFADGQGAYLAAMIALGATATFLHHALRPAQHYRAALDKLVNLRQEPSRSESRPVLAGGLLPSSVRWEFCDDAELLAATDRISDAFAASLAAPLMAASPLTPCTGAGCPAPTRGIGPAWTDDAAGSTLFVPSTIAELALLDPPTAVRLAASSRLHDHRDWLGREFRTGRLTTIYFVERSGAIRITPRLDLSKLPAHTTFAGAGYVKKALSGAPRMCPGHKRARIETLPYLDVVKFGLVHTLCQSIEAAGGSVVGALCFDFAPPDAVVYAMLDEAARLFDLEPVRLYTNGEFERCAALDGCRANPGALSSDEIEELTRLWRLPVEASSDGALSGVRMFRGDQYFGARIDHRDATADRREYDTVVFGRVRRSPVPSIASVVALLVFAAIAAAVILRGVRRKARRMDFALIRGLQVGVVELDAHDVIVGANDRAEEILGMELPSFGGSGDPVLFSSRIDPSHIVMLDDAGLLPDGPVAFCHYDQIDKLRRAGDSSSYYAFTRAAHRMIRISGSTFVSAERTLHTFGTIDTYIDEAHRERVLSARSAAGALRR